MIQGKKSFDISNRKVISIRDVESAVAAGAGSVILAASAVITPSARDFMQQRGIQVARNSADRGKTVSVDHALVTAKGHQSQERTRNPDPALTAES